MNDGKMTVRHWMILLSCCALAATITGIVINTVGLFLGAVSSNMGFGMGQLALYMTIMLLVSVVSLAISSKLIGKVNFKVLVTIGGILCLGGFLLMSWYTQVQHWWVSGVLIGLGAFTFMTPVPIMIANWFKKNTGLALGVILSIAPLAGIVANQIGTSIIASSGWRSAYLILGIAGLVIYLPFSLFVMRMTPEEVGLTAYGARKDQKTDVGGATPALKGVPSSVAFKAPYFYLACIGAGAIAFAANFGQYFAVIPITLGFDASIGAAAISATMLGNVVSFILLGWLCDRIGSVNTIVLAMLVVLGSLAILVLVSPSKTAFLVSGFMMGFALSCPQATIPLLGRDLFGERDFAKIISYLNIGLMGIGSAGIATYGFLYDSYGNYSVSIFVAMAASIASILLIVFARAFSKGYQKYMGQNA